MRGTNLENAIAWSSNTNQLSGVLLEGWIRRKLRHWKVADIKLSHLPHVEVIASRRGLCWVYLVNPLCRSLNVTCSISSLTPYVWTDQGSSPKARKLEIDYLYFCHVWPNLAFVFAKFNLHTDLLLFQCLVWLMHNFQLIFRLSM